MSANKNQTGEGNAAEISSNKPNSTKILMGFIGTIILVLVLWYASTLLYNWYMAEFPSKPTTEAKIVDATNITENEYVKITWDELSENRKIQKVSIYSKSNFTNFLVTPNLSEDHITRSDESASVYNVEFDVPSDPNTILEIKITSDQFKEIKSTKQITD